jgi:transcriptional regulator GlxA family with amidase domain
MTRTPAREKVETSATSAGRISSQAELVLSVCTGALLLAKAGLLDGLDATTHHGAIDLLRQITSKTTIHADRRFVGNGRAICSAGIAAGIDMSMHVVGRLLGNDVAEKAAHHMGVSVAAAGDRTRAVVQRQKVGHYVR